MWTSVEFRPAPPSRLSEEQRTDRGGVLQHRAERGEGGVHRRRELARPAEPRERLGGNELEEDVADESNAYLDYLNEEVQLVALTMICVL